MPTRPTRALVGPSAWLALVLPAALVAGVGLAAPAAAAEDPRAPTATVTRGPSCDPGGMEIRVTAGTAPYDVRLATTRQPDGEDDGQVQPGATVLLHTGPIDWGETVDPRLEYTALDATGTSFVDELDDWSMTRPSRADCAAIGAPAALSPTPSPTQDTETSGTPTPGSQSGEPIPADPSPAPDADSTPPDPTPPDPTPPGPTAVVASGAAGGDGPSSRAVGAGRPITVRAAGFQPGEDVTVRLSGDHAVLARGVAGPDGVAELGLLVPARASGPTRLDVVGGTSGATAGLRLQVAARRSPPPGGTAPTSWPALLALLCLAATGGGLAATLRRRSAGSGRGGRLGSA